MSSAAPIGNLGIPKQLFFRSKDRITEQTGRHALGGKTDCHLGEEFRYVFITVIRDAKRAISHIEGSCGLWSSTEQSEQMW